MGLATEELGFLLFQGLALDAPDLAQLEPGCRDLFPAFDTVFAIEIGAGLWRGAAARLFECVFVELGFNGRRTIRVVRELKVVLVFF